MPLDTDSPAYHYKVIARALALIEAGGLQMSLEDLAARMAPALFGADT